MASGQIARSRTASTRRHLTHSLNAPPKGCTPFRGGSRAAGGVWLIDFGLRCAGSTKPISYVKLDLDLHSNRSNHEPPVPASYALHLTPSAFCPPSSALHPTLPTTYALEYEVLKCCAFCMGLGMHPSNTVCACIHATLSSHASMQRARARSVSEICNGLKRCLRAEGCRLTVTVEG